MNQQLDITAIVEEVVRRLLAQQGGVGQGTESGGQAARQVTVEGRVISVASLPDSLEGVSEIVVCVKAVVTPLAMDHLRDHGVSLVRSQLGAA